MGNFGFKLRIKMNEQHLYKENKKKSCFHRKNCRKQRSKMNIRKLRLCLLVITHSGSIYGFVSRPSNFSTYQIMTFLAFSQFGPRNTGSNDMKVTTKLFNRAPFYKGRGSQVLRITAILNIFKITFKQSYTVSF